MKHRVWSASHAQPISLAHRTGLQPLIGVINFGSARCLVRG
jgi:hypothetical protein